LPSPKATRIANQCIQAVIGARGQELARLSAVRGRARRVDVQAEPVGQAASSTTWAQRRSR